MKRQTYLPQEYREHLGKRGFSLIEELGTGLSGGVYSAHQQRLGRKVAVKFFDGAFVRANPAMRTRFIREAKILAGIQHPNLPYVITDGQVEATAEPVPYFIMEYIHGKNIKEILAKQKRIESSLALKIAIQILDALSYTHQRQIIHRDIKPANIMLDDQERCFVIDFSIGVVIEQNDGSARATQTGDSLGSPPYSAPEQMSDASRVDGRADIYSVGVMIIEMLTGRPDTTNIARLLGSYPRSLIDAVEKACASDRAARHRTAEDFIRALGGRHQFPQSTLSPALAICNNFKCTDANWSPRGFYRGPRFIESSTGSYCTSCGKVLLYQCVNCGTQVSRTPFCGSCGHEVYIIPECKICGSYLKKESIEDMGAKGCGECHGRRPSQDPKTAFDDDIPF